MRADAPSTPSTPAATSSLDEEPQEECVAGSLDELGASEGLRCLTAPDNVTLVYRGAGSADTVRAPAPPGPRSAPLPGQLTSSGLLLFDRTHARALAAGGT